MKDVKSRLMEMVIGFEWESMLMTSRHGNAFREYIAGMPAERGKRRKLWVLRGGVVDIDLFIFKVQVGGLRV